MIRRIEGACTPSPKVARMCEPVFRILTSLIFVVGGLGHFVRHHEMLARIQESPWRNEVASIGDPSVLLWLSCAAFIVFGITLALGIATRASAVVLFLTLVPITWAVHVAPGHTGPLLKNVAILGALLFFWSRGPGAFAVDNRSNGQNGA